MDILNKISALVLDGSPASVETLRQIEDLLKTRKKEIKIESALTNLNERAKKFLKELDALYKHNGLFSYCLECDVPEIPSHIKPGFGNKAFEYGRTLSDLLRKNKISKEEFANAFVAYRESEQTHLDDGDVDAVLKYWEKTGRPSRYGCALDRDLIVLVLSRLP